SFGIDKAVKGYFALFLLLETGMLGTFVALDFFLFFIFWELMLLPMYFLIGVWGGPRREYAAIKFFLYTLLGSVLMLVAILYFYFAAEPHSFDMTQLGTLLAKKIPLDVQVILWVALFIGFAIKIPAFPFHTWLPDAHVEAPTAISVILAGVLLKMGTYGILRVNYGILPAATLAPLWHGHSVAFWLVAALGRLASIVPLYTGVTGFAFFAAMGLPGLSAFISEALVLLGAWQQFPGLTIIAASAVILTAGYLLWALQRMYLGPPNEKYLGLAEINGRELFTLVPLGAIVLFLGIYPTPILNLQSPA